MLDIHCHVLPGIDDGAKDLQMSICMLKSAGLSGISAMVATPHFDISRINVRDFLEKRSESCALLTSNSEYNNLPQIINGAEVRANPFLADVEGIEKLCIGSTNFLLLELPFENFDTWVANLIYELQLKRNIRPILAHVERYEPLFSRPFVMQEMVNMGALTQVSANTVIRPSFKTKRALKKLIKENLIHMIASDTHNISSRPQNLREGYKALQKLVGRETAEIIMLNPEKIVFDKGASL